MAESSPQPHAENQALSFLKSIPVITRGLFLSAILVPLVGTYVIGLHNLALLWPLVTHRFELWRLATSFFCMKISMHWLYFVFMLFTYSRNLEENSHYMSAPADYAFFMLFAAVLNLVVDYIFGLHSTSTLLLMTIIYEWSCWNKDTIVSFFFGIRFRGFWLPWVMLFFSVIERQGAFPIDGMLGIAVGHVYHYLAFEYPEQNNGARLLNTPGFLVSMLPPPDAAENQSATSDGFTRFAASAGAGSGTARRPTNSNVQWRGRGSSLN